MTRPALVVFDVDGTLLDTKRVTVPAVRETFAAFGLEKPDAAIICSFFGKPVADYEAWLADQSSPERAAELVEATNARELRCIGEFGRLYPGARDALETLRAKGYRMAVCSNGPEPYVQEFLDAHDVRGFFDAVRTRDMSDAEKTDMVAEILAEIPADRLAVVGDRQDDIEAAHAHGGIAVATAYGFGSADEHKEADAVVTTPGNIPAVIHSLLGA